MTGAKPHERLSEWMEDCATQLDLSWEEIAARAGMTSVNLRRIRKGQDIPPRTRRKLEHALQVEDGAIDVVLADTGRPSPLTVRTAVPTIQSGPMAEILSASDEELDKMERMFDKFRPAQAREWRAWADGVRALHSEEQNSVPPRQADRDAG